MSLKTRLDNSNVILPGSIYIFFWISQIQISFYSYSIIVSYTDFLKNKKLLDEIDFILYIYLHFNNSY